MPMLEFIQVQVTKNGSKPVEVLIGVKFELSAMSRGVLRHIDVKGIRKSGAVFGLGFLQMLDQQFFYKVFINIDPADRNSFFDVSAQKGALSNLYFMCHLSVQKLLSLCVGNNDFCDTNLVSDTRLGQPHGGVPTSWKDLIKFFERPDSGRSWGVQSTCRTSN